MSYSDGFLFFGLMIAMASGLPFPEMIVYPNRTLPMKIRAIGMLFALILIIVSFIIK